jgi:hypothetical protein
MENVGSALRSALRAATAREGTVVQSLGMLLLVLAPSLQRFGGLRGS